MVHGITLGMRNLRDCKSLPSFYWGWDMLGMISRRPPRLLTAIFASAALWLSAGAALAGDLAPQSTGAPVLRRPVAYTHVMPSEGHALPMVGPADRPARRAPSRALPPTPTTSYSTTAMTNNGGAVVTSARIHNVLINCGNGQCWGNVGSAITPDQVVTDFGASTYGHTTDQYVGTTAANRYVLSSGVHVSYSLANNQASFADVLNILDFAAKTLGVKDTGYGDIYLLHFPVGIDVCTTTQCVSGGAICSFHGTADGTINSTPVHLLFAAIPYQDIPGCKVINGPNELNDSEASAIVAELSETITDPDLDAWYNTTGLTLGAAAAELSDECTMVKHIRYPTVSLNGHAYKIPLLFSNASNLCVDQP